MPVQSRLVRRCRAAALTVAAAVALLSAPTSADAGVVASPALPPVLTFPRLPATGAALQLLGASTEAVVALQPGFPADRLLGGTTAEMEPVLVGEPANRHTIARVVGTVVYRDTADGLVRTDLTDGTTSVTPLDGGFVGASPAGWVAWSVPLQRYVFHPASGRARVLRSVPCKGCAEWFDGHHLTSRVMRQTTPGTIVTRLYVTDVLTDSTTLVASRPHGMGFLTLSGGMLTWIELVDEPGILLHLRPLAGGPTRTVHLPTWPSTVVTFGAGAAWSDERGRLVLLRWDDGKQFVAPFSRDADTEGSGFAVNGVFGVGDGLRVGVSGPNEVAGVWSVAADGQAVRIASAPPGLAQWSAPVVDSGRIYSTAVDVGRGRTFMAQPTDGADGVLPLHPAVEPPGVSARSAGRRLVPLQHRNFFAAHAFFDGRRPGATASAGPWFWGRFLSGPYALSDWGLRRADGAGWSAPDTWPGETALEVEGPRVLTHRPVWSYEGPLTAWVHDVEQPDSTVRVQLDCPVQGWACGQDPVLSGRYVVWSGGRDLVVRDLMDGSVRAVALPARPEWLKAGDEQAVWADPTGADGTVTVHALDLRDENAVPVTVAVAHPFTSWAGAFSVGSGLVAWLDAARDVKVVRLPFAARAPRLLGVVGEAFSPDDDGTDDRWQPRIDLTRPAAKVTVVVSRAGRVVRRLPGTADDASVRDVVWDGTDASGRPVPDGEYTWTMSAVQGKRAAVTAVDGSPFTGRVTVTRSELPLDVRVPFTTARSGAGSTVRVSWQASRGTSHEGATYDVRTRDAGDWPALRPGPAVIRRTGLTERSYVIDLQEPGTVEVSVRAVGADGTVGTWSPWMPAGRTTDDRELVVDGTWVREASPAAYLGTLSASDTDGASLRTGGLARRVTVLGLRCPGCGVVEIQLDGRVVARVDTSSPRLQVRSTLFDRLVPLAPHDLSVVVVGTPGRGPVHVDGIAFTGG